MARPVDLPPLGPGPALRALAEATADALARDRPYAEATLGLPGGSVRGAVLRVGSPEGGGGDVAVICTAGTPGGGEIANGLGVAYVPLGAVSYVVVHDADRAATALTGGKAQRTDTADAPTKLGLRRWLKDELAPRLPVKAEVEASETALGTEATRTTTREVAELLVTVLAEVASDAEGKKALSAAKTIVIDQGEETEASLSAKTLTVKTDLRTPLGQDMGERLENAVSDAL